MNYKILAGNELFDSLWELHIKLAEARKTITDFLKSKGFTGKFASSSSHMLISCDAVLMDCYDAPDGWKHVGEKYQCLYYPLAKNKAMLAEIAALPSISCDELNKLVNFHFHVDGNLGVHHRPSVAFHKKYILISTNSTEYEPVPNMIEILKSEYNKLHNDIK